MASDCDILSGVTLECNEGVGGVKEIYITNWYHFQSGVTMTVDDIINVLPTATLFRYQPNRNTGALTVTPTPNLENGTLYYVQAIEMTLGKLDNTKRKNIEMLAKAKVIAFVRMYDDQILCVGLTDGAFLTAGTFGTGKAKGDLNGYQLTITAEEPHQPYFLAQYTPGDNPFDNFAGIDIDPPYTV